MSNLQFPADFKQRLLHWAVKFSHAVCLEDAITGDLLLGVGSQKNISTLELPPDEWAFGYISYDYKNEIEDLVSENPETISFDKVHFFVPEIVISCKKRKWKILKSTQKKEELYEEINKTSLTQEPMELATTSVLSRLSKEAYLQKTRALQEHIRQGDIYEVNFCQEFYQEKVQINPIAVYCELLKKSPMPFGGFLKQNDKFALCASPERYIRKQGNKILSQPIKGTARRGETQEEDEMLIHDLEHNKKERAENVMAVDVVRNDFARVAVAGTVAVEELCKVYTFKQLHQMISTVSAELSEHTSFEQIIRGTFPMASMTGAPKIRAMELIEQYENSARGLYSGTIGYVKPQGDFDFNVVIRTLLFDQKAQKLSFTVGSAITAKAEVEKEYDECLLKARVIKQILERKNT